MQLSRYCKIYSSPGKKRKAVLFSTKMISASGVSFDVLKDIERGRPSAKDRKTLKAKGLLVKSIAAEQKEMRGFMDDLNAQNDVFRAVIVLNLDCNLACTYCFEGSRKGKFFMSAETADRFVDFVENLDLTGRKEIEVVFYGGEPLLSMDIIVHISKKLRAYAKTKKKKYYFSFITNGTLLTPQNVKILKPLGLTGATVTIDGPQKIHDSFRPFKNGTGSFSPIIRNIKAVCGSIDVQIAGNYLRDNYREFPRLLDYFLEAGLTPRKISRVRFDPVVNEKSEFAPPDFHDGCMSLDEPWLKEAGLFLREEILKRGFATQGIAQQFCLMEHRDDCVVNYDGSLYKCPSLIGMREYCVGDIVTGFLDYRISHALDNWNNETCLACSYLPLCFGGCRYQKLMEDGTMNGISCRKEFFDCTLEQLVHQDMRYNNL